MSKDKFYCTHPLRRNYREDGKVNYETPGNLSHLPDSLIDIIRRSLKGETFVAACEAFEVVRSRAHDHVKTVAMAMQRLGLASTIASQPCGKRDLVLAMVASRIVQLDTKLATSRRWHCSSLAEDFGVADASEHDMHGAMDADTDQAAKATRDPVAPAKRSASWKRKAASELIDAEQPAHSFATLMAEMANLVRNICRTPSAGEVATTFEVFTTANAHQQRTLVLIQTIQP